ncbi:MAG: hypothetical protein FWE58_06550 [Methanobrevibacter sp.]|nr:hypothetical protein [Methanobrevibacter sp.]
MTEKTNNSNDSKDESRAYKREKQKGERWDGYLVKNLNSYQKLVPYLMKTRTGSSNYFRDKFDVTNVVKYLEDKNKELNNRKDLSDDGEIEKYTYNHFFMTAMTRLIALRPHLNRFVAGKKIYQRHNIEISYVIKKEFSDHAEQSLTISKFERDSNIEDVIKVLTPDIKGVRDSSDDDHGDFLGTLLKLPRFIVSFIVMFMDFCIVIGRAPKFLREMDAMQCSVFVTNLGGFDLNTTPVHHLYDRGTISIFVMIGTVTKKEDDEGYEVEIAVTMDERITNGFYYLNSFKLLQEIFNNPEQLDERLKEVPIDE